jgi:glycosyltransferase involved in cell wall biosynthesis
VETIPYGLPLEVFAEVDRTTARKALAVDAPGPVLVAVAVDWRDPRKGAHILGDALARLQEKTTVITLGSKAIGGWDRWATANVHELGFIDHERTRALAYSAADLLVHPALEDNLPNVVLESIACGTPVVGLPIGGVPEMVRPGRTGWLTEDAARESLAHTIDCALRDIAGGVDLRRSCREVAEVEYGADLQAQRYETLFHRMVGRSPREGSVTNTENQP